MAHSDRLQTSGRGPGGRGRATLLAALGALATLGCGPSASGPPNLKPGETVVDDRKDHNSGGRREEEKVPAGMENDPVIKQMKGDHGGRE